MSSALTSTAPFIPSSTARRQAAPFIPSATISVRTGIWSAMLGIGLITPLVVGLGTLHGGPPDSTVAFAQRNWLNALHHPGAMFLKAVLIYPILEEVFYRGLVLQVLRRYTPLGVAVALTSLFFGATHIAQGLAGAVNACLLGAVFSWLTVRTRSLFPSMLCHAAVNFSWLFLIVPAFGVLEKIIALDPARPLPPMSARSLYPAWWLASSVALAIAAIVMLRKSFARPTSA